jgi:hypothetical protein
MPASYRIHADARFVYTQAAGILTGREMVAHARALADDPAFAPTYAQLADFRTTTAFDATSTDMRLLADRNPFDPKARRVALVCTSLAFGMLRMYQLISGIDEGASLVTRSDVDAWTFLGLSPAVVERAAASVWTSDAAAT